MTREDYIKFNKIIQDEIKLQGLEEVVSMNYYHYINDEFINYFTKVEIKLDGTVYACVDVFPYDYIKNIPENVEKTYNQIESDYHKNIIKGMDEHEAINKVYAEYGFTLEEQKYMFPCIHTGWAYSKFELLDSNKIFPLKEVEFNGRTFPIPNDIDYYLTYKYGGHCK